MSCITLLVQWKLIEPREAKESNFPHVWCHEGREQVQTENWNHRGKSSLSCVNPLRISLSFGIYLSDSPSLICSLSHQKVPPKRANLPPELFNMKEMLPGAAEEEEEDMEEDPQDNCNLIQVKTSLLSFWLL